VTMNLQDLIGSRVSIHYNLHRCRAGGDPAPGESCFVVKAGGMSNRVSGYACTFVLNDASLVVQPGGLRRIRQEGVRSVMAYYAGLLTAVDSPVHPVVPWMHEVAFNPFRDDSFVLRCNRNPIHHARYMLGAGRTTWAVT